MNELAQIAHAGHMLLHTPFVQGGLAGLGIAATIDFQAFRGWKSWDDVHRYDWYVASWRWVQGFVGGGLAALGLKAFL